MSRAFGRAVIIGLGGTGPNALIRIKRMLLDHCDGELPPCVRLLALDTSGHQEDVFDARNRKMAFEQNECFHLSVTSVRKALEANEYIRHWWIPYPPLDNPVIAEQPGSVRQLGRMALFVNLDRGIQLIDSAFTALRDMDLPATMRERGMELLDL